MTEAGELEVSASEQTIESTGDVSYFSSSGLFEVVAITLNKPLVVFEEVRLIDE